MVAADGTGRLQLIDTGTGDTMAQTTLGEAAVLLLARDLDGDGLVEVVAVTDGGAVHILRGNTMMALMAPMHPMGSPVTAVAAADVDLDGAVEVVLGGWSEMVAIRVGQGEPLPDLAVAVEGLPEGPLEPGEEVHLLVEVCNRGLAPTGPFETVVTLDGEEVQAVGTSLEPLGWTRLGATVTLTGWGQESTLIVRVDANDTVVEFDEGNNVFEATLLTIQEAEFEPDMRVDGLAVTPSRIPQGTNATLAATVANRGNASFSGEAVVFAVDAGGGRRQLGSHDLLVLPGLSVEVGQTLEGLEPSDVAVLIEVRADNGTVMASLEVEVEVVPRADLGLTGLDVNMTATPRIYSGEPVHLDATVTNTGGAGGTGLLVLEAEVNGTRVVLATARLDLAAGEVARVSLSFAVAEAGGLVLEARILPDGEDIDADDNGLTRMIMVLPHPRTFASLDELLAEMTGQGLHLTVVMRTAGIPEEGVLEVRAYALEPGYALSIADDPVARLEPGSADVYNASQEGLEADGTVLFDTFISPFEVGPNGTVVLVIAYYLEGDERVVVGHGMELLASEAKGGGDGDGDDGVSMTLLVLALVLIAVAVVWVFHQRRVKDTGKG